jgi:2-polyprenyl-3-methyl-5-hydroxy-6-metoxy-1,4-benzoquinol methylase
VQQPRPGSAAAPGLCVWCGAPLDSSRRAGGRTGCGRCGAATTDPWPSEADLAAAYERYRPASGRFSWAGDAILRRTRGRLARRIERVAPPGPVLDVGAGDGTLVEALRQGGREAIGLEREATGEHVRGMEVEEVEGTWAAAVFWHSLEHLPRPGAALEHAASILAGGGLLVVAVPNSASLQARVFGDRWFHLDLPRHLVHLPAGTLEARLHELGLRIERTSHWRGGQALFGWLHGLTGTVPGTADLYDAIRRPEARSAPIPAAHRALTLLAATLLLPLAAAATAAELAARRGGTIYVEARRG